MRELSIVLLAACLSGAPSTAWGQVATQKHLGIGGVSFLNDGWYPVVSIGGTRSHSQGATIGGDAGFVFGVRDANSSEPLFVASVLAGFQPRIGRLGTRAQPFAFVGATLVGAEVGWTVEAGTNYWLTEAIGLRLDVRLLRPFGGEGGMVGLRLGIALR